jgi:S-formylglutathione hydrolase FrmB
MVRRIPSFLFTGSRKLWEPWPDSAAQGVEPGRKSSRFYVRWPTKLLLLKSASHWRGIFQQAAGTFSLAVVIAFACFPVAAFGQGRIDCSSFPSRILRRPVRYCVMLPPGYENDRSRRYPVLYFLHGLGQNEQALVESGGWGLIEDLRQRRTIGEFLIVAPEGRGTFFINSADGHDRYSDFFLSEFAPYVESNFRIVGGRKSRGVTGLSMGGYGALRLAFAHPERFGSVSAQSPALLTQSPEEMNHDLLAAGPLARLLGGVFGNPIDVAHWNLNSPFVLARHSPGELKQQSIYFSCGQQDEYGFAAGASRLHQQLLAEGIRHEFHLYPGGHTSDYFLSHLGETLQFHWQAFARSGPK